MPRSIKKKKSTVKGRKRKKDIYFLEKPGINGRGQNIRNSRRGFVHTER